MTTRRLFRVVSFASSCFASLCFASPLLGQCPDGSPPPCTRAAAPASAGANSVGVMLFTNLTHDSASAYLSDGLASEIATSLARVPRLEVRSPGAVRSAMRGIEPDPRLVGRRLNVRYVVEGDFQRGGDRIRIAVRLVSVPTGTQRWSESYTRPVADLLAVQEEIAGAVVTAIAGQLLPQERSILAARPTRNPEAYDLFLQANSELAKRTPEGVRRAIGQYGAAVTLDPDFVKAQARIGLCYALFVVWGWDTGAITRDSMLALGFAAVDHALAVDSASADAWTARGYLLALRYPRTLDGAVVALRRAVQLDPDNAESWHQYGIWLVASNQVDEGLAAMERAMTIEPGRAATLSNLAHWGYPIAGRMAEARRALDSAIAVNPAMPVIFAYRSFERLKEGNLAGARADAEQAMRLSPPGEAYVGLAPLAWVAMVSGDTAQGRALIDRAIRVFDHRPLTQIPADLLAIALIGMGERERALALLERAEPRSPLLYMCLRTPAFASLDSDARMQRLLEESRPR